MVSIETLYAMENTSENPWILPGLEPMSTLVQGHDASGWSGLCVFLVKFLMELEDGVLRTYCVTNIKTEMINRSKKVAKTWFKSVF